MLIVSHICWLSCDQSCSNTLAMWRRCMGHTVNYTAYIVQPYTVWRMRRRCIMRVRTVFNLFIGEQSIFDASHTSVISNGAFEHITIHNDWWHNVTKPSLYQFIIRLNIGHAMANDTESMPSAETRAVSSNGIKWNCDFDGSWNQVLKWQFDASVCTQAV